ncbi:hypothetical protein DPMN_133157 [Dreissena polymorpha]|uniref:Uncharacterized protein n=1 Tax=Dreissena polymorpha TaxID=45954 RepID=A0A9D4FTQ9_DREPO|nr:hypothetical protein DPMN_133157 [Dreissena polymorpha]
MDGTSIEIQDTRAGQYEIREKSKIIVNSTKNISSDITLNIEMLEEVTGFKYFGVTFTKDGTITAEVRVRITMTCASMVRLSMLCSNSSVTLTTKNSLYEYSRSYCTAAIPGRSIRTKNIGYRPLNTGVSEDFFASPAWNTRQTVTSEI